MEQSDQTVKSNIIFISNVLIASLLYGIVVNVQNGINSNSLIPTSLPNKVIFIINNTDKTCNTILKYFHILHLLFLSARRIIHIIIKTAIMANTLLIGNI